MKEKKEREGDCGSQRPTSETARVNRQARTHDDDDGGRDRPRGMGFRAVGGAGDGEKCGSCRGWKGTHADDEASERALQQDSNPVETKTRRGHRPSLRERDGLRQPARCLSLRRRFHPVNPQVRPPNPGLASLNLGSVPVNPVLVRMNSHLKPINSITAPHINHTILY